MNIVFGIIIGIIVFAFAEDYQQKGGKWFISYSLGLLVVLPLIFFMNLLIKAMP